MFDKLFINDGLIPVGQPHIFQFKYNGIGTLQAIGDFGCACTKPQYDAKTKIVTIKYTPKPVPMHIQAMKVNKYHYTAEAIFTFIENGIIKKYVLRISATPYDRNLKFT